MNRKLKKNNRNRVRNLSPNYTFRAPPYDKYSAFQPGGYFSMYHRVEAEKMKRSRDWLLAELEKEKPSKRTMFKRMQEKLPVLKYSIKEGILKVKIGEYEEQIIEIIPKITPKIEEGMLKVEIGENDYKKLVYIDFRGYLNIVK